MYTSVRSDVSQESGCTSKAAAIVIKANTALMWMTVVISYILGQTEIDYGFAHMIKIMSWSLAIRSSHTEVFQNCYYCTSWKRLPKCKNYPYSTFTSVSAHF